jgi:hypothetical protein
MLRFVLTTVLLLGASVCAHRSDAQPVRATRMTSVSPAHCVAALERGEGADLLRCPTPLRLAVAEARRACGEKGGTLTGVVEGDVWAIDVNADRRNELLFALDGNVACTEPWNLFACGTAWCPREIYELRDGMWTVVGNITADSPEEVTLGTRQSADGHRSLEVCANERCSERTIYEWIGSRYEVAGNEVREGR